MFGSQPSSERGEQIRAAYFTGDEHMLNTLDLTLLGGRNFDPSEVLTGTDRTVVAQVAIVSKSFIDEKFPEGDGLGQTIYMGNDPLKIIGIVGKISGPWLKDNDSQNVVIMPNARADKQQKFIVRAEADQRAAVMRQIDDILLAEHSKRVIMFKRGMDEAKDNYNASDILMLRMLVVLIVVLVLVTALGIFGMTLFNINKRTKQIGTRRALGARKSAIVKYFLTENSIICLSGMLIGSIAAVYLGDSLMTHFSIPALELNYILATAVFVLLVSLISVIFPAIRAANIAPSIATRSI
jgi:putative ABC transport system permease protein